jgi:LmbE family N-acetylglucosaminyl deacetylase
MSDNRDVPTGRLGRLARLATLGARTGVSLLTSRDGQAAAAQAAQVLGHLRGLAGKVGQMASYIDGVVPAEHRAAYEAALASLRSASRPKRYSTTFVHVFVKSSTIVMRPSSSARSRRCTQAIRSWWYRA